MREEICDVRDGQDIAAQRICDNSRGRAVRRRCVENCQGVEVELSQIQVPIQRWEGEGVGLSKNAQPLMERKEEDHIRIKIIYLNR